MRSRVGVVLALLLFFCSRVPAIVISEVMYHPQTDEPHNEYVEIYNETAAQQDLGRWQFTDGIRYTFPAGAVLGPRAYLVIARDPATITSRYGILNVVGPFEGALDNSSDHVILRDPAGGILAEVDYSDDGKWPLAADGAGHSLSKLNLRGDPNDPDNWRASPLPGGTPGRDNGFPAGLPSAFPVVLNEVCFHTSGTQFIELYNAGDAAVNVGGFYLSDDPDNLQRFQIPAGTILAARGRRAFLQTQLGFTISTATARILFISAGSNVVLDGRVVEAGPAGMSEGRWPDGGSDWFYMMPTTGTANAVTLTTSVVINEIMYHPPSNNSADEYVELYNAGSVAVNLTGWGFSRGISFDFPAGTTIGPGQFLVIAKDRDRLISRYGLSPAIVLGNFGGELSDEGEKIRLRDANRNVADEVTYWDGGHWSEYADGYGSSLELIDPRQDNRNWQAWAPSDETAKVPWTGFSYSGTVSTPTDSNEHELHLLLVGKGVALIDDVHLTRGGAEYIANGAFENSAFSWLIMGNHVQSSVVTEPGSNGTNHCLRIVTTGGGDTGANHIEQTAVTAMPSGQVYALSFRAKWQWGNNLLVTRCWNNQLPETHVLPIPANTGTPGAVNSVFRANLGPVFSQVSHSPVVPTPSDSVLIRARVSDPDGVASAYVFYKANSDSSYASAPLRDDGAAGDVKAGDGIYMGMVPPRSAGQTVAFYLTATDRAGAANSWPANIAAPAHYRVESGAWTSAFPTYRIVMTAGEEAELFNRPHLSNEPVNCTFIFDEKDIYYNCGIVFTGSPYGRGGSGYRGYDVSFNSDEKLHGWKEARFDQKQNGGYRDRISYDLLRNMGLPTCPAEWFDVRLNARAEGVYEDLIAPGKLYLNKFFRGDDNGPLFELASRYEFTNNNDLDLQTFDRSEPTWRYWGADKDVYRSNYRPRNHDREDDFTSMTAAVEVVSRIPNQTTEGEVARHIDVRQWLRVMAVRSVNSDWDFFGTGETKNAYFYRPAATGRWVLLPWDCELAFDLTRTNVGLWCYRAQLDQVRYFQRFRSHEHYFLNAAHEYMTKYFNRGFMEPWIDYYFSLVGGVSAATMKQFIDNRRTSVTAELAWYLPPRVTFAILALDPLTVPGLTASLSGTAPINASWIRCQGKVYAPGWTDATHWYAAIDVVSGTNLVTVEFLDYDQQWIGSDTITIISLAPSGAARWRQYR